MNEIDANFVILQKKKEIIEKYVKNVRELEAIAHAKYSVSSSEFTDYLYHNIFDKYKPKPKKQLRTSTKGSLRSFSEFVVVNLWTNKRQYFWILAMLTAIVFLVNHKIEASNFFMRNIQTFIYPGMRAWRRLTLPIIETFPALTKLYDETCLVENPFFQVAGLDCGPCKGVVSVLDVKLAGINGLGYLGSSPYILKVLYIYHIYDIYCDFLKTSFILD